MISARDRSNFPDALAAAPLAARMHAPLLLVAPQVAPAENTGAAAAMGTQRITLVGGESAVPDQVAQDVAPGADVDPIAGGSRHETAALAAHAAVAAGAADDVLVVAAAGS